MKMLISQRTQVANISEALTDLLTCNCILFRNQKLYISLADGLHCKTVYVTRLPQNTKTKLYSQLNVALKNGRENDSERRQNHLQQSQVAFQKTFWTLHGKTKKFRKLYIFFCFGEMKLVETLSLLIDIKLKQISNAQKKNQRQATNLLFCC